MPKIKETNTEPAAPVAAAPANPAKARKPREPLDLENAEFIAVRGRAIKKAFATADEVEQFIGTLSGPESAKYSIFKTVPIKHEITLEI